MVAEPRGERRRHRSLVHAQGHRQSASHPRRTPVRHADDARHRPDLQSRRARGQRRRPVRLSHRRRVERSARLAARRKAGTRDANPDRRFAARPLAVARWHARLHRPGKWRRRASNRHRLAQGHRHDPRRPAPPGARLCPTPCRPATAPRISRRSATPGKPRISSSCPPRARMPRRRPPSSWLLQAFVVLPWIGAGALGLRLSPLTPLLSFALNAIFGLVLGALYRPRTEAMDGKRNE